MRKKLGTCVIWQKKHVQKMDNNFCHVICSDIKGNKEKKSNQLAAFKFLYLISFKCIENYLLENEQHKCIEKKNIKVHDLPSINICIIIPLE